MRHHIFLGGLISIFLISGFVIFEALPRGLERRSQINKPTQFFYPAPPPKDLPRSPSVTLGGEIFEIDIASTAATRAQGLSGRPSLGKNEAMLFIFESSGYPGFWMKDMKFPIDIIWIKDNIIVGWEAEAQPDDRPNRTVYHPPAPVNKVLEVSAGTATRLGLKVGDIIKISLR